MLNVNMAKQQTNEYWRRRWVDGQILWHNPEVHPSLIKHVDKMTAGQEKCRIYVPLCGKSLDMKWLADRGHEVIGVELSSIAIKDFFQENSVEFSVSPVDGLDDVELYKSKSLNIYLYKANMFNLNRDILGEFDCIWDRASLVALLRDDIQRYADLILTLLKSSGRYLLSTHEFDQTKSNGHPYSTPVSVIEQLFASHLDIKLLDEKDAKYMYDWTRNIGFDSFIERTHLLTYSHERKTS